MNYDSRYLSFDIPAVVQRGRHRTVNYPVVHSFPEPSPHSKLFPFPVCPKSSQRQRETSESSDGSDGDFDLTKKNVPLSQSEMNDKRFGSKEG